MMKISCLTLDNWIKNGFIKSNIIPNTTIESFQIDEVIEQLSKHKQ